MPSVTKKKRNIKAVLGRPTIYKPELVKEILRYVADGDSLRTIGNREGMPHLDTLRDWIYHKEDFSLQYAAAKRQQADHYADKIADIANATLEGRYDPAAARVALDAFKWTASKLKPQVYGDKIDVTSDGKALPQPITALEINLLNTIDDVKKMLDAEIIEPVQKVITDLNPS